jgi:hypothetical protein
MGRRRPLDKCGSDTTKQLNRIYERDKGICQACELPCARQDASRGHSKRLAEYATVKEARSDESIRLEHTWCNSMLDRNTEPNHRYFKLDPRSLKALMRVATQDRISYREQLA